MQFQYGGQRTKLNNLVRLLSLQFVDHHIGLHVNAEVTVHNRMDRAK